MSCDVLVSVTCSSQPSWPKAKVCFVRRSHFGPLGSIEDRDRHAVFIRHARLFVGIVRSCLCAAQHEGSAIPQLEIQKTGGEACHCHTQHE